jgi:DNA repair protein RadA/Sms
MDLPVALALISGLKDVIVSSDTVAFGEIGLTGEIRAVSNADLRVAEAARMGFRRVIVPHHNLSSITKRDGVEVIGVKSVRQAFEEIQQ